jgi:hypothetical protein
MAAFFAMGIEKMQIVSNREWIGNAEVKFWSFASDEKIQLPVEDTFASQSLDEQRAAVRSAADTVLGMWEGIEIDNVEDGHTIRWGDTGVILFQRDYIPMMLNWTMFAMESDDDIRQMGSAVQNFLTDERVNSIAGSIRAIAGTSASPASAAALTLGKQVMQAVTTNMMGNEDDQLAVIQQSFIRPRDYPAGTRQGVGVQSMKGNAWYDYFIYGMSES